MNERSERLSSAIEYLCANGLASSQSDVARKLGVTCSTLNMAVKGSRAPAVELLLKLCDVYPINFWWLRSGEGEMLAMVRENRLMQIIAEKDKIIDDLKRELELRKNTKK